MPRPPNLEVRYRLLSIGREVVHDLGFNGCGVQDITAAAGVPKGSFYNYFESKESFAADILEDYWKSIEERHGPILYDSKIKPLARVRKFFRALSEDHARNGYAHGCLIGNLSLEMSNASDETRQKLTTLLSRWQNSLTKCLRDAQEHNELDAKRDTKELAAILIEAYEGAVLRAKVERSGKACERFEKVVLPQLTG